MSERYSKVFSLPENLYTCQAPVVLAAGALLKDNQTGNILLQLKLHSVSSQTIKAVTVSIQPLDTAGQSLGEAISHPYLDLTAQREEEFGQRVPVPLPDPATRGVTVQVTEVVFADNTCWHTTGDPWAPLPAPAALDTMEDAELARQFRLTYGAHCNNLPLLADSFWLCACGALNQATETRCSRCGIKQADLAALDLDALCQEKNRRVAAERAEASRLAAEAEAKRQKEAATAKAEARKIGKRAAIILPILAVVIAAAVLILPNRYKNATYQEAVSFLEAGAYDSAIPLFAELGDYKDSPDALQYATALKLLEAKDYTAARTALEQLGDYRDAADYLARFQTVYRLVSETMSRNGQDVLEKTYEYTDDCLTKETQTALVAQSNDWLSSVGSIYTLYAYDGNENISQKQSYYADTDVRYCTTTYAYDEVGNITQEVTEYLDGSFEDATHIYEYDADGNRTKWLWYQNLTAAGEPYCIHEYEYDAHGQTISESDDYDWLDKDINLYENEYDEQGQLIRRTGEYATWEYEYDENGNMVTQRELWDSWSNHTVYTYDEAGNMLSATTTTYGKNDTDITVKTYTYEAYEIFE